MRLRSGKIHRFNINAKEFVPSFLSQKVTKEVIEVIEEKKPVKKLEEQVYLNTLTGQLIYMMATTKNVPKYLQPYEI